MGRCMCMCEAGVMEGEAVRERLVAGGVYGDRPVILDCKYVGRGDQMFSFVRFGGCGKTQNDTGWLTPSTRCKAVPKYRTC